MEHAGRLVEVLEQNNVHVLKNEVVELNINGRNTTIVGVDDMWQGLTTLRLSTDLIHMLFTSFTNRSIKKTGTPIWSSQGILMADSSTSAGSAGQHHGLVDIYGLTYKGDVPLFVSRGIGTSNFGQEYRFMASPEIILINP